MSHAIIIPNRNRDANLELCLRSLCSGYGNPNIAVYLVEYCPASHPTETLVPIVHASGSDYVPPFNKGRLLNLGIEAALADNADVLTFLDADTIVGPRFLESIDRLADESLTKLCYRVKDISAEEVEPLRHTTHRESALRNLFADYDSRKRRLEGRKFPHLNPTNESLLPLFGNSQFSIRASVLADLRYDERFKGRGFEDIDFNWRIWQRYFDTYRAEIVTDADHALYNITGTDTEDDWGRGPWNTLNSNLYLSQFGKWQRQMRSRRCHPCNNE